MSAHARDIALVAAGGAAGSVLRYLVGRATAARQGWPGWWRPLVAVGVLGGYTTFSTFSLEAAELALHGRVAVAAAYAVGSLAAGIAGAAAGLLLGRAVA